MRVDGFSTGCAGKVVGTGPLCPVPGVWLGKPQDCSLALRQHPPEACHLEPGTGLINIGAPARPDNSA